MMKSVFCFLLSLNALALPVNFKAEVQKLLAKHESEKRFVGLSMAVVDRTGETLVFHHGVTDLETKKAVSDETLYEIGSISKTFTRLLVAKDAGLSLGTTLDEILPKVHGPHPGGQPITLENMITHTAFIYSVPCLERRGLPGLKCFGVDPASENPYQGATRRKLINYISELAYTVREFHFPPAGRYWAYSNIGMGLIGEVLAEKKNLSYEQLLKREVLDPLSLKKTTVSGRENLAKIYRKKSLEEAWRETPAWDFGAMAGAGGIRSPLPDMVQYLKAQMGLFKSELDGPIQKSQSYLREASQRANSNLCKVDQDPKKAFCNPSSHHFYEGWEGLAPGTIFYHAGGTGGSQSMVAFSQDHEVGVVILSNSGLSDGAKVLVHYPNDLSLCLLQLAGKKFSDSDVCAKLR